MQVISLKCEYGAAPLGIDVSQPRLFWRVSSPKRGQKQTAYQILAASSPETLAADMGDMWDTGWIPGDQTTHIPYGGTALHSSGQVFWKVRAQDRNGQETPWSETVAWTTGVLSEDAWQGRRITSRDATESLLLRKEFTVRSGLKRAVVHVCGLGQHELQLNGAKVGADLLSPGWTNYNKTTLYDTYDVTEALTAGANAAALTIGNGMYNVVPRNRFVKFYKHLADIDTDSTTPGFKKIILKPDVVGDLKWVEASYNSLHGAVHARWEREGSKFRYQITIPTNTTTTVYLPGANIKENGLPAESAPGIELLRHEPGHTILAIESGGYMFESELPIA